MNLNENVVDSMCNWIFQTTERTSRKREAGAPTTGGIPSKLAVSSASHVTGGTCTTNAMRRTDVSVKFNRN